MHKLHSQRSGALNEQLLYTHLHAYFSDNAGRIWQSLDQMTGTIVKKKQI